MTVAKSSSHWLELKLKPWQNQTHKQQIRRGALVIRMRDRSKNRKPLQKGRNLSIEAIQAVQALKRAHANANTNTDLDNNINSLEQVFNSKFSRLLKFDMMAVLRELLRQNQCLLALKVFDDIRKECWYRPRVSMYAEMIQVFGDNRLFEHAELLYLYLKREDCLEPEIEGFNALLKSLVSFELAGLVMDCYNLMIAVGCEPDRSSFRIVINGLEAMGEAASLRIIRQDALKYYGELEFFEEEEEEETAAKA